MKPYHLVAHEQHSFTSSKTNLIMIKVKNSVKFRNISFRVFIIQFFLPIPKSFQHPPNANDLFSNLQAAG